MADGITVKGLDHLESQLRALSLVGQKQVLTKAVRAGADVVVEAAERNVPRDTGFAAEHINKRFIARESTVDQVIAEIGPEKEAFYVGFLETGTAHMPARPWLRPALEESREAALAEAKEVLADEINKLAR